MRRKQKNISDQIEIPESSIPSKLGNPHSNNTSKSNRASPPTGSGTHSPISFKNPSPRKLHQFDSIPSDLVTPNVNISGAFIQQSTIRSVVPSSSPAAYGEFNLSSSKHTSPSRKLQQVFEQALIREAEERATYLQVQIPGPNPKVLYNARGQPYEEGAPIWVIH